MIELAGASKGGLELRGPLMLAGGYGREFSARQLALVHALVTRPIARRPRVPQRGEPRVAEFAGGFMVSRESANPGLAAVLRAQRHTWARLPVPLILTLAYHDAANWGEIAARTARIEAIGAFELELIQGLNAAEAIHRVREATLLPVLALIPIESCLEHAEAALEAGADALVIGIAPLGLVADGQVWEGRINGPTVKPLALRAVYSAAKRFPEAPIVGAGGIESAADVKAFLEVGARAVQVDTALWRNPNALEQIASGL